MRQLCTIEPSLAKSQLATHILNLVSSNFADNPEEIEWILLSSYTGKTIWKNIREEVSSRIKASIEMCIDGELLEVKDGKLVSTKIGKLAAKMGVDIGTAIQMNRFALGNCEIAGDLDTIEILTHSVGTVNGKDIYIGMSRIENDSGAYITALQKLLDSLPSSVKRRMESQFPLLSSRFSISDYEGSRVVKKVLLLNDWITGVKNEEIEQKYHSFLGSISSFASEFSWLAETFANVAEIDDWPEQVVDRLKDLPLRIAHGVPSECLELTRLRTKGFTRGRMIALAKIGLVTIVAIAATKPEDLPSFLTSKVTRQLLKKAKFLAAMRIETKAIRILRARERTDMHKIPRWKY